MLFIVALFIELSVANSNGVLHKSFVDIVFSFFSFGESFEINKFVFEEMVSRKYFTPREVSFHNTESDLWVSFLGKVHDLTKLCEREKGNVLLLFTSF